MPSDRTSVTELGTGLGMLGHSDMDDAVRSRSPVMHSLSPEMWHHLAQLHAGGAYDAEFHAAWANGRAFLAASEGLRGRLPEVIEWKGTGCAPGRRGGADRSAGGPRLPRELQVPLEDLVQCVAGGRLRPSVAGGPEPGQPGGPRDPARRGRLVRRGGAGPLPVALRGRPDGGARRRRCRRPGCADDGLAVRMGCDRLERAVLRPCRAWMRPRRSRPRGGGGSRSGRRTAGPPTPRAVELTTAQRDALGDGCAPAGPRA